MPKPITPFCGCDVFITNNLNQVLLIKRADNSCWALPGGCQDLGETAADCAKRECFEESGFKVKLTELLGIFSSQCYEFINYPWKDNQFTHILFKAEIIGGSAKTSHETTEVKWFAENEIPNLSDGHAARIKFGFEKLKKSDLKPYFE